MNLDTTYKIDINVESSFIDEQSEPSEDRFVFAYTITIHNVGNVAAKLISRHWVITDAHGKVHEVRGLGVVGEQPHLNPGERFQYTSGTILETPVGSMSGSYTMLADDQNEFDTHIPTFTLSKPNSLH